MICNAEEVLKIAREEIGYKEKASNSHLDDKTANAGSGNYTKFARDTKGYWGDKQGFDWCTSFVLWCIWMACGKNFADAKKVQPFGTYGASCKWQTQYYQTAKRWSTVPHVGDQAFFTRGHTGIVEKVEPGKITLIEGNCSNAVCRRTYAFPNAQFSGFGMPRFAPTIKENPVSQTAKSGDRVTFSVSAQDAKSYQWQYSPNGWKKWKTWLLKTKPNEITKAHPGNNGCRYRCVVKNSYGERTSSDAKLTVK